MQSTGGVADRFAPLVARLERRLPGGLPFAVRFWDDSELRPEGNGSGDTIVVRDTRALSYIATAPNQVGLGRAWVAGDLELDGDLERALRAGELLRCLRLGLGDRIASLRAAARAGSLRLRRSPPPQSEAHLGGRLHSLRRDRAAVRHHYDVSNEFYRLVLGPSMVYSCAYFDSAADTLEQAQDRKLDVVCRKLRLAAGESLLDVGCGWGSLVLHAAANYGVRAVGVTLSEPQAELARERIRDAGLAERCEIRVQDYREVSDGPYDKVASIGMYEHVGASRLDRYMGRLRRLVRPGGLVLNHGIVRLCAAAGASRRLHPPLRLPRRGAPPGRPRGRLARAGGTGAARQRVAARALRADPSPLGVEPRRESRGGACGGRRRAREDLAPLHDRIGPRLRARRHLRPAAARRRPRGIGGAAAGPR